MRSPNKIPVIQLKRNILYSAVNELLPGVRNLKTRNSMVLRESPY